MPTEKVYRSDTSLSRKCTHCGGNLRLDSKKDLLRCEYCGAELQRPVEIHITEEGANSGKQKKPFYWRYIWLASFAVLGILLLAFSTNDPTSPNWARQKMVDSFIHNDLAVGIFVMVLVFIGKGIRRLAEKIHDSMLSRRRYKRR